MELVRRLVERGQTERVLRPDLTGLDLSRLVELFSRAPYDLAEDHVRARLLALALDGLRALDTDQLPGPTPTAAQHESRWLSQTPGTSSPSSG